MTPNGARRGRWHRLAPFAALLAPACQEATEAVDPRELFAGRGKLPGSECRPEGDPAGRCDVDLGGRAEIDLACVGGFCTLDCGADALLCARELGFDYGCATTVGGFCAERCAAGCDEGFACFGRDGVCLPTGSVPGGSCRPETAPVGRCDGDVAGVVGADMRCERERCVIGCAEGGDALCAEVDDGLVCTGASTAICAERCLAGGGCVEEGFSCFERDDACLPTGAFPGSPCRAEDDPAGPCDGDVDGVAGADMICQAGLCVIDCAAGGDALCAEVSADLACAETAGALCAERCLGDGSCRDEAQVCFERDGVCLPAGSYPGAPCRREGDPEGRCDAAVAGVPGADMRCEADRCVIPCEVGGHALCAEVDEDLACSDAAGMLCVEKCDADRGCRDPAFACFEDDLVCLPRGAFPGSPCREGPSPCDHDLDGDPEVDMRCVEGRCTIDCERGGDALCADVDESLTCVDEMGVCVRACELGTVCRDRDMRCYEAEGACLPTGSFPGSECRRQDDAAGPCDTDLFEIDALDMTCMRGVCLVSCLEGGEGICRVVDASLGCSVAADSTCLLRCDAAEEGCPEGSTCLESEGICMPIGSFPGGPCRDEDDPAGRCDEDIKGLADADMRCREEICVLGCEVGGDALCADVIPDLTCAERADHLCAERCRDDGGCRDPGFECFEEDGVCLPRGTFPGSACRAADDAHGPCDAEVSGVEGATLRCERGVCVVDCESGGDGRCAAVDAELACAETFGLCARSCLPDGSCAASDERCFEREGVCLPEGSVPGGPCRAAAHPSGACDADVAGVAGADMRCEDARCVIACEAGGDALCEAVHADLACSEAAGLCAEKCTVAGGCRQAGFACFEDEGVCLPAGAFPGSPCREGPSPCDHDLGGDADADMVCVQGTCTIDCGEGGDALCAGIDASLTCVDSLGVCARACDAAGGCADEGDACFSEERACLPIGSFPGSACRAAGDPDGRCDTNLFGLSAVDMVCERETCLVTCAGDREGVCPLVDRALGCAVAAGGYCVKRCEGGCDEGFACFDRDDVCLPEGSFPGGPCRAASDPEGACDQDVGAVTGADMSCRDGLCVISCAGGGDALCASVDASLTCAEGAGELCAERCVMGADPRAPEVWGCRDPGFECFERDRVCLPRGGFPGSPCRDAGAPGGACDGAVNDVAGADMRCEAGTCVIGCAVGGDALCAQVSADLACAESASVCAERCLAGGGCRDATFACFDREGVCLPIGAFPGGPCRAGDDPAGACDAAIGGVGGADMRCEAGRCVIPCESDARCAEVDPRLACSPAAGVCAERCGAGAAACDAGFACFAEDGVCLPLGSFPGSACRAGSSPCDHDLRGDPNADMACVEGLCVVDCAAGGDSLCADVDVSLTCVDPLGVCVRRCGAGGTCAESGEACFSEQNACLPIGAFPGSPCRVTNHPEGRCDEDLFGVAAIDMICERSTCVVSCADEPGVCPLVDASLACATAAGVCVKRCDVTVPGCEDGFECFEREDVCLPEGSFPGSFCRSAGDPKGRCDSDLDGNTAADMTCRSGLCVLPCTRGGDALCASIDASLACGENAGNLCAERCLAGGGCRDADFECFAADGVCLPRGSFPGSACRASNDPAGACDTDVNGVAAADMRCERGLCVIGCEAGGDGLCTQVSSLLACGETVGLCAEACLADGGCRDGELACYARDGVCLPVGAVPGGPCRAEIDPAGACDGTVAGVAGADMRCENDLCVIGCAAGGDALCAAVDESLACAEEAGAVCAEKCLAGGGCSDPAFSCFGEDGVCLPTGSFPGSPCRAGASACDHDLAGNPDADMKCVEGQCVVACDRAGDSQCRAVDTRLTCFDRLGVCVRECQGALCEAPGESCFVDEGACLPTGSFPSSPCRTNGEACDQDLFGVDAIDMICLADLCVIGCGAGTAAVCALADPTLRCAVQAGGFCARSCDGGCDPGFACFEEDGVCLPTGGFPGSPCRDGGLRCDTLSIGPMACVELPGGSERCLLDCEAGGDATCGELRGDLVCSASLDPPSCLPIGAFVGSPCRDASDPKRRCDATPLPLACVQDICTIDCAGEPAGLCDALASGFVCAEEAGGFCQEACQGVACPAGRACFEPDGACLLACSGWDDASSCAADASLSCDGAAGVCRPRGTFAGAGCRAKDDPEGRCDPDFACVGGACVPECTQGGDALCALWSTELGLPLSRCVDTPSAGVCAAGCDDDADCAEVGGFCDGGVAACLPYRNLSVLHTGGLRGHVLGASPHLAYTPASAGDDATLGGFSRLAAALGSARSAASFAGRATFALDTGDFLMGTAFALLEGTPERDLFDLLDYDAVALGDHELAWGPDALAGFLDKATEGTRVVPWLAANLVADGPVPAALAARWSPDASAPVATHPLRPWVIIERDGIRLGVFGLLGEDAARRVEVDGLGSGDLVTEARATIERLRAEGVDAVVLLAHTTALAPPRTDAIDDLLAGAPGIDLVIAGHGDGGFTGARTSHGALVVQVPPRGATLGEARLALGREGLALESTTWTPHPVDDAALGDPAWAAREDGWRADVDDALAARGLALDLVLTTATFDLDPDVGSGDLVVDATLAASETALATSGATHASIALARELGDAFRALRDVSGAPLETAIAVADAWALCPHGLGLDGEAGDPLVDVWVTTEDLRKVMEVAATLAELEGDGLGYRVAGLVVDVRDNAAPWARVVGLYRTDASGREATGPNLLTIGDPASTAPGDLHRVTVSLGLGRLLAGLQERTGGALSPVLRTATGAVLSDVADARVDRDPGTAGIQELDAVDAVIDALVAFETDPGGVPLVYAAPSERFRVCTLPDPSACPAP